MRKAAGIVRMAVSRQLFPLMFLAAFCVVNLPVPASGQWSENMDFHFMADLRTAVTDSAEKSWLDKGMGKTRYGTDSHEKRRLVFEPAEASFMLNWRPGFEWAAWVHLKSDPEQKHAVDLVEGFISYSPVSLSGLWFKARAGVFFSPISLEHEGLGWSTTHTITASAINSWVAEELRTVGAEATVTWRMPRRRLSLTGALFGANDPAGTLLAWRGWALHDRKTGITDRLALPPLPGFKPGRIFQRQGQWDEPFHEIDNRIGFYLQLSYEDQERGKLNFTYYDNQGDPTALEDEQYAWDTWFYNFGLAYRLPWDLEWLSQYMVGYSEMGKYPASGSAVFIKFESFFVLLSKKFDRVRLTLRHDNFRVADRDDMPYDNNSEDGHAWTAAAIIETFQNQLLMIEVLDIESERPERRVLNQNTKIRQTLCQISYRFYF